MVIGRGRLGSARSRCSAADAFSINAECSRKTRCGACEKAPDANTPFPYSKETPQPRFEPDTASTPGSKPRDHQSVPLCAYCLRGPTQWKTDRHSSSNHTPVVFLRKPVFWRVPLRLRIAHLLNLLDLRKLRKFVQASHGLGLAYCEDRGKQLVRSSQRQHTGGIICRIPYAVMLECQGCARKQHTLEVMVGPKHGPSPEFLLGIGPSGALRLCGT